MPDRTFTEGEHYALVDDAVKRETASATTRISELDKENIELKNANDVLVTEKAAETTRADEAAQALIDFKGNVEQEKAREARRTDRVAEVTKAAPSLEITQERSDRIVAMSDELFTSYLSDLREVAAKKPKLDKDGKPIPDAADDGDDDDKKSSKGKGIPRESAAFGGSDSDNGNGNADTGTVKHLIGASRALRSA